MLGDYQSKQYAGEGLTCHLGLPKTWESVNEEEAVQSRKKKDGETCKIKINRVGCFLC